MPHKIHEVVESKVQPNQGGFLERIEEQSNSDAEKSSVMFGGQHTDGVSPKNRKQASFGSDSPPKIDTDEA